MTFDKKELKNGTIIVYGFREDKIRFKMIMTLEPEKDKLIVHGFLSQDRNLNPYELIAMWKYLGGLGRRYIEFEAVPEHARVYKTFLTVVSTYVTRTFNGHECEHLTVDMSKGIKHFKGDSA